MAENTSRLGLNDMSSALNEIEDELITEDINRTKRESLNETGSSTSNSHYFSIGRVHETNRENRQEPVSEEKEFFDRIMKQFSNMTSAMAVPVHQVITKFSGKPTDFKSWILDIERYANLVELDRQKLPSIALITCSGAVADFIRRYLIEQDSNENIPSWGDLKKLLKEKFGEVLNKRQAQMKLRNLKQKNDESVQMFGERIIEAAEDVYTLEQRQNKKTKDMVEQQLIDTFCNGVNFDYIKMKLIREEPATLEAAIKIAKREQNIRDQIALTLDRPQTSFKLSTDKDDRDIQPMEVDHLRNRLCKNCFKKSHSIQNCPKIDVSAADESDSDSSESDSGIQISPINKNIKHVKFKEDKNKKQKQQSNFRPRNQNFRYNQDPSNYQNQRSIGQNQQSVPDWVLGANVGYVI